MYNQDKYTALIRRGLHMDKDGSGDSPNGEKSDNEVLRAGYLESTTASRLGAVEAITQRTRKEKEEEDDEQKAKDEKTFGNFLYKGDQLYFRDFDKI